MGVFNITESRLKHKRIVDAAQSDAQLYRLDLSPRQV
jgi:hypothetical protein